MGVLASPRKLIGTFWVFMQTILLHSRVMAKVGEFDPAFWTGQDEDFIFRLDHHTALCYRNSPLVLIDRTPQQAERLTGVAFCRLYEVLQLRQRKYEKWRRLTEGFSGDIKAVLRSHLREVHSKWVNWSLMNNRYKKARRVLSAAARADLTSGIAAK